MIPAKTPIMSVTLMTRPIMISLSAIGDLPPSPYPDGPSSNRGGCVIAASFAHLVSAREQGRQQVEAKPRPLNAYAYEIETLAASPTCWARIFNVGRSLRLAYPEAEAAGGARSAPSGGSPNQCLAVFYSGDRFAALGRVSRAGLHDGGKQGVSEWHTRGSHVRDCRGRLFGARWVPAGRAP